jgi:hypothetical protein
MSTLVLIHELLLDRRLVLEEVIDQYHDLVKIKEPRNFTSEPQYNRHLMDTGLPFSFFIKELVRKKKLPRTPHRMIKDKAVIALED